MGSEGMAATLLVVGLLAAAGAGFGIGWGLKSNDTERVLAQQNQTLDLIVDGQTEILTAATQPVVLDAELRATLAAIPIQCLKDSGGSPDSPMCAWATCLQYGQSSAQRPECRKVEDAMLAALQSSCVTTESDAPEQ
ncbi:MAG: hypothetical protein CMA63_06755 [Euryarchaeota archaeon]|nr:hypothetical protein [Euryarchaeota archaeon]